MYKRDPLEEDLQGREDFISDEVPDGRQEGDDWLPWRDARLFGERYNALEVELHLHLRVRFGSVLKDWGLVCKRAAKWPTHMADLGALDVEVLDFPDSCDEWRETMLVEVVEGVEGTEVYAVPTFVRLEPLQGFVQPFGHLLLGADLATEAAGEFGWAGCDRELSRSFIRRRIVSMDGNRQPVREMVKGLSETVGDLPSQQRNHGVVRLFKDSEATGDYLGLRIALIDNQASVTLRPSLLSRLERIEMFERPVQLQAMAAD